MRRKSQTRRKEDTIRVSLTSRPGGDRREEVYAALELLQALGLRQFAPSVTACPGCGRTTSSTFQELAERISSAFQALVDDYVATKYPRRSPADVGAESAASLPSNRAARLQVL